MWAFFWIRPNPIIDVYLFSYNLQRSVHKKWRIVLTLWAGSHGSQVPSPIHVSKSQHEGKVSTFEPQETIEIWFLFIKVGSWLVYAKSLEICVESWVLLLAQPNSQHKFQASPQKNIAMQASTSNLGVRTWDPCEVVSPNFHALNDWDCRDWPQVTWDLGLGTRVNQPHSVSILSRNIQLVAPSQLCHLLNEWENFWFDLMVKILCEVCSPHDRSTTAYRSSNSVSETWSQVSSSPFVLTSYILIHTPFDSLLTWSTTTPLHWHSCTWRFLNKW